MEGYIEFGGGTRNTEVKPLFARNFEGEKPSYGGSGAWDTVNADFKLEFLPCFSALTTLQWCASLV